ncbi:MAG: SoxR reducing system RseC family protein [Shewanella sp.]|nr:SoxR reducing system RseC family protein [Shewanella sp.]MCF1431026.1 SoxR reducing system RseC family protein [Shewanella sp.]MCF1456480.1 SoxR reducing system RseC family protein [Shewanella sp.]
MMEQQARVLSQTYADWVQVEVEMKSACNHCDNSEQCGTASVAKAFSVKEQRFSVPADRQYEPGDLLKLGLPESVVLKSAALVYLPPLFGLLGGGLTGQWLASLNGWSTNSLAMFGGFFGALLCWCLGKRAARQLEAEAQPVILAYLGKELAKPACCANETGVRE